MSRKHAPDGVFHEVADIACFPEPDLAFCGVDVYIHIFRGYFEVEDNERVSAGVEELAVSIKYSAINRPVAHPPAIDISVDIFGRGVCKLVVADKALEVRCVYLDEF